ncbi:M23 family metallopeptidase [Paenibacillus flagellatus]|uniref:M23 family peptidase n=1 Tax=Paenibacillus flagellatus TaxID=2211139 RepID=A0A2V5KRN0_9BACL|nr:M23 family metallopeptidase [Paenibacillus flagellatus]PYI51546.1 M23 family peptidase [Paenibacillus flagellatus]
MKPDQSKRGTDAPATRRRSRRYRLAFAGLTVIVVAVAGWYGYDRLALQAPGAGQEAGRSAAVEPAPAVKPKPEAVEFRMTGFERGWVRYADGVVKSTEDGGATWKESAAAVPQGQSASGGTAEGAASPDSAAAWDFGPGGPPKPESAVYETKPYPVKQSQFITDRVGWALVSGLESPDVPPLLLTTDGGRTWRLGMPAEAGEALQAEEIRLRQAQEEAAMYAAAGAAQARQAGWSVQPEQASPGDVVLVRRGEPGEVAWQGKTYKLQPFGAGYYTYLPISMQVKPGDYAIGDRTLTVKAKTFETQRLTVSKQMESMKRETERIQADQKKIDAARSRSEPEFLFASEFRQPVEGILTTPYGYTRYVNGKLDSTHTAIDLAAKEGTPIHATNDGIVALADSLYLTGNSIYIDHGMGLFSQYAHLSELRVKTGARVKRGDVIGLVGTTGFSTGPHLHFTFWAHNVPVNPNLFFGSTPFRWGSAKP